jgi:hypothetical protein
MAKRRRRLRGDAGSAAAAPEPIAASDGSVASTVRAVRHAFTADWGAWLALLAGMSWFLGHFPPFAGFAIPVWVISALVLGLLRPWYGVLLTVIVVPFTGGGIAPQPGEVLRVVPVYGAAVRVLADRFIIAPGMGRTIRPGPPWWVVAAAVAAGGLYLLTALTGYLAQGRDPAYLESGLYWTAGGAAAMVAAWIAASHIVAGRDRILTLVVFCTTVVACLLALGAWAVKADVGLFTFPGIVEGGRLGALGYPTPTAMGLATAAPLAVVAAFRIRPWLVVPVLGLILLTMILTWSRGPLIAVGVGTVVAALAYRRIDRRVAIAGTAVGALALVGLVFARYGTNVDSIVATINASMGSDVDRVNTWIAAITITMANPLLGGGWYALTRVGDFASRRIANSHNIVLDAFASGGLPLGITYAIVIVYSGWMVWVRRHTMAPYLIAAAVTFLVCGFWDIPQVRSYAAVMGGLVLGMAAGPLIGRASAATAARG